MTSQDPGVIDVPPEVEEFLKNPGRGIPMTSPRRRRVWRVKLTLLHGVLSADDWRTVGHKVTEGENYATFLYGENVVFTVDVGSNFDMEGAIRAAQGELAAHIGIRAVSRLTVGCEIELTKGSLDE